MLSKKSGARLQTGPGVGVTNHANQYTCLTVGKVSCRITMVKWAVSSVG